MSAKSLLVIVLLFCARFANAQQKTASNILIDSLPESEIDIPIQINLKPIYALAESNVDTVFTSPNYPKDWVQADCQTRYKYHFRRSPLVMSMSGTVINLSFTGHYQIVGATRGCIGGVVVSPWTPACSCGFQEGERRVNIGFTSSFLLRRNYMLESRIVRNEPQAIDKCSVCFWGQDITGEVMKGLKEELDASKKEMEKAYGAVNLKPYMQQAWNILNEVYAIPNVGYFTLHPKRLRMDNINAKNDLLHIDIGISATPVVSFARPAATPALVPDLTTANHPGGFNIYLEAALEYDSLSKVMNGYLAGKRFDVSEGLFKKHIVVNNVAVSGGEKGALQIGLDFSGSFDGRVTFTGKPAYNVSTQSIEVQDLDYDLQTKNLLLKTAKWLFNKRIISELKKYTAIDLSQYYDTATTTLNTWLNREWTRGITGSGSVSALKLTKLYALPQHLLIRSNCTGQLSVVVSEISLKF